MDQLHRPDLGGAADRAGREGGLEQIPDVVGVIKHALHLTDDVHHVGVALDHHQLGHLDRARLADPAQVVAAQIHQHHVFGAFLGIGQQLLLQGQVVGFISPTWAGAGDRSQGGPDATGYGLGLHHHLGTGADQIPAAEVEEGHVRRWIHHPQAAVQLKGIPLDAGLQPLAEHQLKDVAGGDVLPGRHDRRFEISLAAVAAGLQLHAGFRVPAQGVTPTGSGPCMRCSNDWIRASASA